MLETILIIFGAYLGVMYIFFRIMRMVNTKEDKENVRSINRKVEK